MLGAARTAVAVVAVHLVVARVDFVREGNGLYRLIVLFHANAHQEPEKLVQEGHCHDNGCGRHETLVAHQPFGQGVRILNYGSRCIAIDFLEGIADAQQEHLEQCQETAEDVEQGGVVLCGDI